MTDTTKMTAAAYKRLEADVLALETDGRREKAEKIGVAREFGDLKENAEYHAAKEDAAMLEAKINRMRQQLRSAEILEVTGGGGAGMGSTVTYTDGQSDKQVRFKLVPGVEAKPAEGLLSIDSPVGRALNGSKAGETRTLETPKGTRKVQIVLVEHS